MMYVYGFFGVFSLLTFAFSVSVNPDHTPRSLLRMFLFSLFAIPLAIVDLAEKLATQYFHA